MVCISCQPLRPTNLFSLKTINNNSIYSYRHSYWNQRNDYAKLWLRFFESLFSKKRLPIFFITLLLEFRISHVLFHFSPTNLYFLSGVPGLKGNGVIRNASLFFGQSPAGKQNAPFAKNCSSSWPTPLAAFETPPRDPGPADSCHYHA